MADRPIGSTFSVISNSGQLVENGISYSNACIWISIRDYLARNGRHITVTELRQIAGFTGRPHDMFDSDKNPYYLVQMTKLLDHLGCTIHIFRSSGNILINRPITMGTGRTIIPIVNYDDAHFELIIGIDDVENLFRHHLNEDEFKSYRSFKSNPRGETFIRKYLSATGILVPVDRQKSATQFEQYQMEIVELQNDIELQKVHRDSLIDIRTKLKQTAYETVQSYHALSESMVHEEATYSSALDTFKLLELEQVDVTYLRTDADKHRQSRITYMTQVKDNMDRLYRELREFNRPIDSITAHITDIQTRIDSLISICKKIAPEITSYDSYKLKYLKYKQKYLNTKMKSDN